MRRFPKSAVIPFAIGEKFFELSDTLAREFLSKAVVVRSDFAGAWFLLSQEAERRGDMDESREYLKRAIKISPDNPDYRMNYAFTYRNEDHVMFDSLAREMVWQFPNNRRGAQALYWLAEGADSKAKRNFYLDQLYNRYRDVKGNPFYNPYVDGTEKYYEALLETNLDKAFELAASMSMDRSTVNRHQWKEKLAVADKFLEARQLLLNSEPAKADSVLKGVVPGNFINLGETLLLFKAQAKDADNRTREAYDSLLLRYGKQPSVKLRSSLLKYAARLGMDELQVQEEVRALRDSVCENAALFCLPNLITNKKNSLCGFSGKVTLIIFWYPGCFSCTNTLYSIERVLKKFDRSQLAYVGIDVDNFAQDYVVPFTKSGSFSFIPLKDDPSLDTGNLDVLGAGACILIGKNGRLVFSEIGVSPRSEEDLELMIRELIDEKDQ